MTWFASRWDEKKRRQLGWPSRWSEETSPPKSREPPRRAAAQPLASATTSRAFDRSASDSSMRETTGWGRVLKIFEFIGL